jgi:hypothetical protein
MTEPGQSLIAHRLELAKELVDDTELSRLAPEQLLLKAYRLARLSDNDDIRTWLHYELNGYPNNEEAKLYMDKVWRWTDKEKNTGWWVPFASINGSIAATQVQIQQLKVPDVHLSLSSANPSEFVGGFGGVSAGIAEPANSVLRRLNDLTSTVTTLNGIRSRILARIHVFATDVYYKLAFGAAAESIFQRNRTDIDELLRKVAPDVIEKMPAINDRLVAGDSEAISQAMNTCRRMIKAFADSVYPPGESTVTVDGHEYEIGSEKVLNRIELFCIDKVKSKSRRERLVKTVRLVYDRTSTGVHTDILADEARSIFLLTYIILGEILLSAKV